MNRRGFLGSLCAAAVAPFIPLPKPAPPQLFFHKDAFALTMASFRFLDHFDAALRYESQIVDDLIPVIYTVKMPQRFEVK